MRILVTGSKGLLGTCLVEKLKHKGISVIEADLPEYSIISYNSIKDLFNPDKPFDYLINCAAFTDVSGAEIDRKKAYYINSQACGMLSRVCYDNNIHLIHFSTDFVFDGLKGSPYVEDDITNPINYYGESKLQGENIIKKKMESFTIFRLQWLYGISSKTFFSKILEKSKKEKVLKVVDDEIGSPCSVNFISDTIYSYILNRKKNGETYHLTHNNFCSRCECAKYFLNKINWDGELVPISTNDLVDTVSRPKFGVMSNRKLSLDLGYNLESWENDLDNFLRKL